MYAGIASSDALSHVEDVDRFAALIGLYVTVGSTVLFAAVFGAVHSASDLRHGTATTTYLAAPRRGQVVAAKILVSAAVGAAYAVVAVLVSLASLAVFGRGALPVDDGLVVAICLLGVVVAALWGVLGCGLGLLMGSPTWAVAIVAWVPVGELIVVAVLGGVGGESAASVLPGAATVGVLAADRAGESASVLPFSAAVIVLLLWAAAFAAAGWLRTLRRDLT